MFERVKMMVEALYFNGENAAKSREEKEDCRVSHFKFFLSQTLRLKEVRSFIDVMSIVTYGIFDLIYDFSNSKKHLCLLQEFFL